MRKDPLIGTSGVLASLIAETEDGGVTVLPTFYGLEPESLIRRGIASSQVEDGHTGGQKTKVGRKFGARIHTDAGQAAAKRQRNWGNKRRPKSNVVAAFRRSVRAEAPL